MKRSIYLGYFTFFIMLIFSACKKNDTSTPSEQSVSNAKINGHIEKGPFILGSSITIYDLKPDLSPTGKSFNSQITDNLGSFSFNSINLSSTFASFKADGYYYNEAALTGSYSPITLYALCKIEDSNRVNVNLLTHLEKSRVEYLIGHGSSFEAAKIQAESEILSVFKINKNDIPNSENLSISAGGENSAILLAISLIFESGLIYNGLEAKITELLASFSGDLKNDGIVNDHTLPQKLLDNAVTLDTVAIKNGIIAKYSQLGSIITVADFGKYIDNFISKTSSELFGSEIYYPFTPYSPDQQNLLLPTDTIYHHTNFYFLAYLGRHFTLSIKFTDLDSDPNQNNRYAYFVPLGTNTIDSVVENGHYVYNFAYPTNLSFIDLALNHRFKIEYFENGAGTPSKQKIINVIP